MKHSFFVFPSGLTGSGLFVLRMSVVLFLTSVAPTHFAPEPWLCFALGLLALLLTIGFCTRTSASVAAIMAAAIAWDVGGLLALSVLGHMFAGAAVAMVGPGAFSMDARLFGRRTLHLSD